MKNIFTRHCEEFCKAERRSNPPQDCNNGPKLVRAGDCFSAYWRIAMTKHRGFTLVEMLLYMGILTVLMTVMSMLLASIMDVQMDSESTSVVDQDSRFIQARMTYDMQRATSIALPAAGATGSTLQVVINAVNYTYSVDGGGNLVLTDNSGADQLNSSETTVSGVSFQRVGNGDDNDTIRVTYTVTSDVLENSGQESRTIQTTLGLQ